MMGAQVSSLTAARSQRLTEMLAARDRLTAAIAAIDPSTAPDRLPRRRRPAAVHGTDSGYYRHRRGGGGWSTTPCEDCRAAHADSEADRAARRRAAAGPWFDEVAVARAVSGAVADVPALTLPERRAVVARLVRAGWSSRSIGARLGVTARTVDRDRDALGLVDRRIEQLP